MKLPWTAARAAALPEAARAAMGADRPLGWARDLRSGATVVAGTAQVYAVGPAGEVLLARPWHLVDGGSWDRDAATLTVTWVDKEAPARWRFDLDSGFPEVFRARVQASVVRRLQHDPAGDADRLRAVTAELHTLEVTRARLREVLTP